MQFRGKFGVLYPVTLLLFVSCSQHKIQYFYPQPVYSLGDYIQPKSGLVYPMKLDGFYRESITKFNDDETNIGVSYRILSMKEDIKLTIYSYHYGNPIEDRLLISYYHAKRSVLSNNPQIKLESQRLVDFARDSVSYGVEAVFQHRFEKNGEHSILQIYECGEWIIKYRVTSARNTNYDYNFLFNHLNGHFTCCELAENFKNEIELAIVVDPKVEEIHDIYAYTSIASSKKLLSILINNNPASSISHGIQTFSLKQNLLVYQEIVDKWNDYVTEFEFQPTENDPMQRFIDKVYHKGYLEEYIINKFDGLVVRDTVVDIDMKKYNMYIDSTKCNVELPKLSWLEVVEASDSTILKNSN